MRGQGVNRGAFPLRICCRALERKEQIWKGSQLKKGEGREGGNRRKMKSERELNWSCCLKAGTSLKYFGDRRAGAEARECMGFGKEGKWRNIKLDELRDKKKGNFDVMWCVCVHSPQCVCLYPKAALESLSRGQTLPGDCHL